MVSSHSYKPVSWFQLLSFAPWVHILTEHIHTDPTFCVCRNSKNLDRAASWQMMLVFYGPMFTECSYCALPVSDRGVFITYSHTVRVNHNTGWQTPLQADGANLSPAPLLSLLLLITSESPAAVHPSLHPSYNLIFAWTQGSSPSKDSMNSACLPFFIYLFTTLCSFIKPITVHRPHSSLLPTLST